ncbi:MAG: single-stranded-DNA-specific exonuclease RecJ [Phormidesmis sp.]
MTQDASAGLQKEWPDDWPDNWPDNWIETVGQLTGLPHPIWGARLLWDRKVRSAEALKDFLHPADYIPASPFDFGEEMVWAVERLVTARLSAEKVAIWGDFDADGVTSTAVLWDGLREFFPAPDQLTYFIPNRLKASHGLSMTGVEQLAAQGVTLMVTCDTGSTNPKEIERANALGIDVIVTDHHTLPTQRPAVVAIVNPRALPSEHPMAHLSGVAVAYKLIEALYERLPDVSTRPLSEFVDLVAIGLIADLVELKGDCRYLAQIGIAQLQTHLQTDVPVRPGVARLLQLCQRAGDRPTDISFGLGPRINAVSRIYGDASFCVELLTSTDPQRCRELAEKAELANARRKALQNDLLQQVTEQLNTRDLSTTGVIVLCDAQWPVGVLGLVAGQVAQRYGKPTILLTLDSPEAEGSAAAGKTLARGSARSVNQIDLYDLVSAQAHLLTSFGGHPFAAGLSLPLEDLPMFTAAINQQYRQKMSGRSPQPSVVTDLTVTVADLGRELFQQMKLLEPCGMGNPVPKLLIKDCWFENVWHQKLKDRTGSKVGYIKASFNLCDESIKGDSRSRFPGLWWGHYKEDLPPGRWDVVAELDYNSHPKSRRYEVRLINIFPSAAANAERLKAKPSSSRSATQASWLLDRRLAQSSEPGLPNTDLILNECPTQWQELGLWQHQAHQKHQPVALAYASPLAVDPTDKWKTLLGLAKYMSREQMAVTAERLGERLGVCDRTLSLGLLALEQAGFEVQKSAIDIRIRRRAADLNQGFGDDFSREAALSRFLSAVQEEYFRRQYFYQAPVSTLEAYISTDISTNA